MSKPSLRSTRQKRKTLPHHRLNKQERIALKSKRQHNLLLLRQEINTTNSIIEPRTSAHNRKSSATTLKKEHDIYEDALSAQLLTWRAFLPQLLVKLSKVSDPRNPTKIKHKITVVLFYGLLQFMLRIKSRRSFNEHLTKASVLSFFQEFFPEIDTIPHADTIARLLSRIKLDEIEAVHISLIKKLLRNKKFKNLLIFGHFPIAIDGTQKAVRNDQLETGDWLVRTIHTVEGEAYQQYILVLEANFVFSNGLTVPLLTEYCYLDDKDIANDESKQDSEIKGYFRLTNKLKRYFPRLDIIMMLDNLYACESVIADLENKNWEFMIKLPAKLKTLSAQLKAERDNKQIVPEQPYWRERKQSFHWCNYAIYKGHTVHLVGCLDKWFSISRTTGEKVHEGSEHTWISSLPLSAKNIHALCNLAARNRALIEDSFNTEKNRGYEYQHLFSHDWNAMQAYHLMMRLAHAINALSEYTKRLKRLIKANGCCVILTRIFDAIKHRATSREWITKQLLFTPQIKFDFPVT